MGQPDVGSVRECIAQVLYIGTYSFMVNFITVAVKSIGNASCGGEIRNIIHKEVGDPIH